jgi:hypothetical protein
MNKAPELKKRWRCVIAMIWCLAKNILYIASSCEFKILIWKWTRVGTKTLFWPFVKTKTLTKSILIFAKFRQFFAKGFCENFLRNVFAKVQILLKCAKKHTKPWGLLLMCYSQQGWCQLLFGHFSRVGASESLIWLEPKLSGSSMGKIKFSQKLSRKFRTFAKMFSRKQKLNFGKTFPKKIKSKTFVPTLIKYVVKPHHFHTAPTPSQYF